MPTYERPPPEPFRPPLERQLQQSPGFPAFIWFAVVALAYGASVPANAAQGPTICIAVPTFENTSSEADLTLGHTAASEVADQVFGRGQGQYEVVGPSQIQPLLEENRIYSMDPLNLEMAAIVAEEFGCPYVLAGRIAEFSISSISGGFRRLVNANLSRATATLNVHLIDATSRRVVISTTQSGTKQLVSASTQDLNVGSQFDQSVARQALGPAVEKTVDVILRQQLEALKTKVAGGPGLVVGVRGGGSQIYIDRGTNRSVFVGQTFGVHRVVDEIRDAGGNLLDQIVERIGTLEVVRVLSRSAMCRLLDGSAEEGDVVEPEGTIGHG